MYKSKCYVYLGFYFLHTHWNQHKERKKSCMLQLNFLVFGIRFHSVHAKLLQCCPTPCDPMDCSQPDSSVHRIFQARILKWVAISSRESSWPRYWTFISYVSALAGGFFTTLSSGEPMLFLGGWWLYFSDMLLIFSQSEFLCFRYLSYR